MRLLQQRRNRWGGVLVFCALAMCVLLAMGGLVIDGGNLFLIRQRAQAACDSAALMGAQKLPTGNVTLAQNAARLAFAQNGPGGDSVAVDVSVTTKDVRVTAVVQYAPSLLAALGVRRFAIGATSKAENIPAETTPGTPASSNFFDPFNTHSWFAGGIFAKKDFNLSNSVTIQGYNSTTGISGGLPVGIATDGGFNLSNSVDLPGDIKGRGNLNMSNSVHIGGDAFIGGSSNMSNSARIDGDLKTNSTQGFSNSASVGGTKTPNAGQTIPVGATELLKTINMTAVAASNNNAAIAGHLSGGNPPSLNVANNATVTLPAGTYYFNTINLNNSSTLNIPDNVTIYLTGGLNMSNSSKFSNTDPKKLMIYTNGGVNMANSTKLYAGVYAPNGLVNLSNSTEIWGGVVADQIGMANSARIMVDMSLRGGFAVTPGTGNVAGTPGTPTVVTPAHFGIVE